MEPLLDPLLEAAKKNFGIDYLFPYQRLVITNILEAAETDGFISEPFSNPVTGEIETVDTRPHQIVILPTGAGKSLCFTLPAVLIPGCTLVIFPLLSLIADQARRLIESGVGTGIIRGGQSKEEREEVWRGIKDGSVKIILSNPESVLNPPILERLKAINIKHLVIDETHTVSEWGETFRPVYLKVGIIAKEAGIPVVTAFTATASTDILEKVKQIVFPDSSPNIISANPDRPNISYSVIPTLSKDRELVKLLSKNEKNIKRPALVFCRSRKCAEMTARLLRDRLDEKEIFFYHAGLEREEKTRIENWFFSSEDGILCSTTAYGMGVDKSNIRTVIHRDISPSIEAYLQESGRGGRDREKAEAILLFSSDDVKTRALYKNSSIKRRYTALLEYAQSTKKCRREYLLSLLNAEPEACFGCDVCNGTALMEPEEESILINFFKNNKRRYIKREIVLILAGNRNFEVKEKKLYKNKRFGLLKGWDNDDIENTLNTFIFSDRIRILKRGFWKYKVTLKA